jgi:hypothetical protein
VTGWPLPDRSTLDYSEYGCGVFWNERESMTMTITMLRAAWWVPKKE